MAEEHGSRPEPGRSLLTAEVSRWIFQSATPILPKWPPFHEGYSGLNESVGRGGSRSANGHGHRIDPSQDRQGMIGMGEGEAALSGGLERLGGDGAAIRVQRVGRGRLCAGLQAMQELDGALGMGRGGEDRPLVAL